MSLLDEIQGELHKKKKNSFETKFNIVLIVIFIIIAVVAMKKFGFRHAGIKELQALEKRIEILENK